MGVELRPYGVKCNIQCQYCYQNPERDAGNTLRSYDIPTMQRAVEREGGPFTLFGGEPLMVPLADLEQLWAWGLEKYGENSVQTNGVLINDDHRRLFKKYRVHVGISIDGPGPLNDVRWAGSLEATRAATARTEAAIERLCRDGAPPSLIVTLHRNNATADKLPAMFDWFRDLDRLGITSIRLHILEVEAAAVRAKYALTAAENTAALLGFAALEPELRLRLDLFQDMRNLLLGRDRSATCVWGACDPYTTAAVRGVEGNGQSSNCGRTNKDGIDFAKASREGFERYLALYQTPQAHGGCADCRFFLMCKGQCPGTALDGDWRNRTEHCDVWKSLFRHFEEELLGEGHTPVSVRPARRAVEAAFVAAWSAGHNASMAGILDAMQQAPDAPPAAWAAVWQNGHGDAPHGDAPHGDAGHGDAPHGDSEGR